MHATIEKITTVRQRRGGPAQGAEQPLLRSARCPSSVHRPKASINAERAQTGNRGNAPGQSSIQTAAAPAARAQLRTPATRRAPDQLLEAALNIAYGPMPAKIAAVGTPRART